MLSSRCSCRSSRRICAWMVTSSARRWLVGDQNVRAACQRDGDHDALARAAGELVRVLVESVAAPRECGRGPASRQRGRGASRCAQPLVQYQRLRDLPGRRRMTGLSEVMGSWKMTEISLPRMSRMAGLVEPDQLAAAKPDAAGDDASGRHRDQSEDGRGADALAAARSADDAEHLAAVEPVGEAIDGAQDSIAREEPGLQSRRRRAAARPVSVPLRATSLEFVSRPGLGSHAPARCAGRAYRASRRPPG